MKLKRNSSDFDTLPMNGNEAVMSRPVAFITGASSGIGWAAALAFARAGYDVCGFARRTERLEDLGLAIDALPGAHGDFRGMPGDVRAPEDLAAAVEATLERFGRLDLLIANAGLGQHGSVAEADWLDLKTVLRTNIDGCLHSIRACIPAMRMNGGGHILIISSVVAGLRTPYTATYAASKAFVSSLAGSLRLELEADNIAVTDVLVGRTVTEFNQNRLGGQRSNRGGLPSRTAVEVAAQLVKLAERKPKRAVLSLFDRLVLAGGLLAPGVMARLARWQYKPRED